LVVEVKNSGAPSIAERWKLLVTIDGKEYEPMGQEIPQPLKLKLTFVDIVGKSYTAVNLADSKIGPTRYPGLTY
jgi:hypothetical protein